MFDPLASSPFADDTSSIPPWPTTPHTPGSPIPNLRRSQPQTPIHVSTSLDGTTSPYGKEPQIYGQPESGLISPTTNKGVNGKMYEKQEPYLRARITMLDRNRRDILIRFDAQTNLPNFTGSTYRNISRSYAEFQQLYDGVVYNNPQTIVPALPLAQTSAPTDEEDDRLVRIMLQRWLTRVCEDPFLMRDEELRSFIESDFGYQPMPRNPRRKAGSGFSLIKRGVPDEDETLQRARFELTKLEGQFFDAAKAIDKLARSRRTLSLAQAEMGNKLVSFATSESHPPLANALNKLGRAWHTISDLDGSEAISECVIIGDSLGYQGVNSKSAKETLQQRTAVLEEYQAAVKTSISKRRQIERLKSSSSINPARVDEALEDLEEANKYEQILAQRVDGISHNLHLGLERHNKLVEEDVRAALIEHARTMLLYERKRLRELEALLPDIEAADSKYVPTSTGPPRPKFIPKLEDDLRPAPPPVHVAAPPAQVPPLGTAASFRPPGMGPVPPKKNAVTTSLPPQSPGAGPSTPISPASMRIGTPTQSLPNAPGEPPLGGRLMDGTKSMFITPSVTLAPSSAASAGVVSTRSAPTSMPPSASPSPVPIVAATSTNQTGIVSNAIPGVSIAATAAAVYHETDPLGPLGPTAQLHRPSISNSTISPLGHGTVNGVTRREEIDPLGLGTPVLMTQSMHLPSKPQRPRINAREAASKLANF